MAKRKGLVLMERDLELVLSVYKYRYLSITQAQVLHFPSAQTATRRIRLLSQGGYLATFRVPGVSERLIMLTEKGAEVVAEHLLVPLSDLGLAGVRKKPKDYYFLKHFLAVSDFRISLTRACAERPEVELLGFIPEHLTATSGRGDLHRYIRSVVSDVERPRAKITHTPDGVFALKRGPKTALFFLEIDRGTEVLSNPNRGFLKMIRFYLNYLVDGGYHRYQDDFRVSEPFNAFRVLTVTTSAKRLENIRTVGGRLLFEPAHAKRFLWLATEEVIDKDQVFSPCWASLDPEDEKRYALISSA